MLFKRGHYPVHQIVMNTEIDGMKNIGYDNGYWRHIFHLPDKVFWCCNYLIFQIQPCFKSLCLICLSHENHLLQVLLRVSQFPPQQNPFPKQHCQCVALGAIGLLDWVKVNVFEVVSCPCTDDRIALLHLTFHTYHKLYSVEKHINRIKSQLHELHSHLTIIDWLYVHGSPYRCPLEWYFRCHGKRATRIGARFEMFNLILKLMFLRLEYTGNSFLSP